MTLTFHTFFGEGRQGSFCRAFSNEYEAQKARIVELTAEGPQRTLLIAKLDDYWKAKQDAEECPPRLKRKRLDLSMLRIAAWDSLEEAVAAAKESMSVISDNFQIEEHTIQLPDLVVKIEVKGGVAYVTDAPDGVQVKIHDLD